VEWLSLFKNKIKHSALHRQGIPIIIDKKLRCRGWVFIDALLGVTILAIGIIAIILAMTHNTKVVALASNHTKATYLAEQKLEELKKYDGGTTAPTLPEDETEGIFSISYALATVTLPVSNVTPVHVTVTWTEDGQANTVKLGAYYYHK